MTALPPRPRNRTMLRSFPGGACLLAWSMLCGPALQAQTNVPVLSTPNIDPVEAGSVSAMLRLADGRIMVGGDFERLGLVGAGSGCGRLLPDGSADASIQCAHASPGGFLQDGSGRVYASRNTVGGDLLVRLLEDGSIDPAFTAVTADASIFAQVLVGDAIYLGGLFTTIQGQPRTRLAKIDLDGNLDPTWTPSADVSVNRLLAPGDGTLIIAGSFTQINGEARNALARLALASGSLDGWQPDLTSSSGSPLVQAIDSDGAHLYVSGSFSAAQGQPRQRLAKLGLDAAATLDADWAPAVTSGPSSAGPALLRVIGEQVYVGGSAGNFTVRSGAAMANGRMLRVSRTGTGSLDVAFDPFADITGTQASGPVALISGDGGGRLFVGGAISQLSQGDIRLGLAALNADGSVDALSALAEAVEVATVGAPAFDSVDASLYVPGSFLKVNGVPRQGLIRLLGSGAVDSGFRPPAARYGAVALANGALYASDDTTGRVRKLDPLNGDPVAGFVPIAYLGTITQILVKGDHAYLLGIFNLSGISPPLLNLARLNLQTDTLDEGFRYTPNSGAGITRLAVDPVSDSLFVAGNFTSLNGVPVSRLARINGSTLLVDPAFAPLLPSTPSAVLSDGQDGLWLHGVFSTLNGQTCRGPARLLISTQGGLDPAFNCNRGFIGGSGMALALDSVYVKGANEMLRFRRADGGEADPNWRVDNPPLQVNLNTHGDRLFAHGVFTVIAGEARNSLASLPLVEFFFADGFE